MINMKERHENVSQVEVKKYTFIPESFEVQGTVHRDKFL